MNAIVMLCGGLIVFFIVAGWTQMLVNYVHDKLHNRRMHKWQKKLMDEYKKDHGEDD